jgi:glycosyltransferase involved in cell wall biosynthesis
MRACVIVPALDAATTVGDVVDDLAAHLRGTPIVVVDDGSADATGRVAAQHGAAVLRHERNRGKGAAIVTGLREAERRGHDVAVTVDADGQHPARSARLLLEQEQPRSLVLGVRDLLRDGAPGANRFGNEVSNYFLSRFAGRPLRDTQCGLRRYPVSETLALGTRAAGYAFEAEVVLRALARGLPLVEVPVHVVYPAEDRRVSHFRNVRDPARIVFAVLGAVLELRLRGRVRG